MKPSPRPQECERIAIKAWGYFCGIPSDNATLQISTNKAHAEDMAHGFLVDNPRVFEVTIMGVPRVGKYAQAGRKKL